MDAVVESGGADRSAEGRELAAALEQLEGVNRHAGRSCRPELRGIRTGRSQTGIGWTALSLSAPAASLSPQGYCCPSWVSNRPSVRFSPLSTMARVAIADIRSSVEDTGRGLEIVIPARRRWFTLLFLAFWLLFWTFGGITAVMQLFAPDTPIGVDLFMLVWLCGWAAGEAVVATIILWMLRGQEVVTVTPHALLVRREVFGLGPTHEFDVAHISDIRASPVPFGALSSTGPLALLRQGIGTIAFDYGAKTYRFGISMEEAEARLLIKRIEEKVPLTEVKAG